MKVVGSVVGVFGVLLFVGAVVVGTPVAVAVVGGLHLSALWSSWAVVEAVVGGVVGLALARWGLDH